jgi:uncharacterized protein (TIGR02246 family)
MADTRGEVNYLFHSFADRWKSNDGQALASCFAEDGSLINPFGQRANGREAIAAMYSDYFGGMLNGTSTTIEIGTIREVPPNHAFVDSEQTIEGDGGDTVLSVHTAALLRRAGDTWRIVDARPYTIPPMPS